MISYGVDIYAYTGYEFSSTPVFAEKDGAVKKNTAPVSFTDPLTSLFKANRPWLETQGERIHFPRS